MTGPAGGRDGEARAIVRGLAGGRSLIDIRFNLVVDRLIDVAGLAIVILNGLPAGDLAGAA